MPRESSLLPRQTPAESEGHTRGVDESVLGGYEGALRGTGDTVSHLQLPAFGLACLL